MLVGLLHEIFFYSVLTDKFCLLWQAPKTPEIKQPILGRQSPMSFGNEYDKDIEDKEGGVVVKKVIIPAVGYGTRGLPEP
ncbi:hypothetical protein CYL15_13830 [Geobacillus thermodenitrificans]|nr:hypothetical protein [Geobacillus thermodenitrificans]